MNPSYCKPLNNDITVPVIMSLGNISPQCTFQKLFRNWQNHCNFKNHFRKLNLHLLAFLATGCTCDVLITVIILVDHLQCKLFKIAQSQVNKSTVFCKVLCGSIWNSNKFFLFVWIYNICVNKNGNERYNS